VLASNGDVFSFGASADGQLGLGAAACRETFVATPQRVTALPGPARAVAAGGTHSVVVLDDGTAMAFGSGRDGQLGNGAKTNRDTPERVDVSCLAGGETVTGCACGPDFTLLLTSRGSIISTGSGLDGALGQGGLDDAVVPGRVKRRCGVFIFVGFLFFLSFLKN
jgi:alpha-tubulin suppressor-like RCC1 family protein